MQGSTYMGNGTVLKDVSSMLRTIWEAKNGRFYVYMFYKYKL